MYQKRVTFGGETTKIYDKNAPPRNPPINPAKWQPQSHYPAIKQPHHPAKKQPHNPAKRQPHNPAKRQPHNPAKRQPHNPAKRQPHNPAKRQPHNPAKRQPHNPAKRQPQTPAKGQPHNPAKRQPHSPAKRQPHNLPKGSLTTLPKGSLTTSPRDSPPAPAEAHRPSQLAQPSPKGNLFHQQFTRTRLTRTDYTGSRMDQQTTNRSQKLEHKGGKRKQTPYPPKRMKRYGP